MFLFFLLIYILMFGWYIVYFMFIIIIGEWFDLMLVNFYIYICNIYNLFIFVIDIIKIFFEKLYVMIFNIKKSLYFIFGDSFFFNWCKWIKYWLLIMV